MKKRRFFASFIFLQTIFIFFAHQAIAFDDNISSESGQLKSIEELSSKIGSSLPHITPEHATELAEAVYLIGELEREIFLTNQLIELREKGELVEKEVILLKEEVSYEEILEMLGIGAEEIVIAKQISEELQESLPREEKSLMVELEEEDRITPFPSREERFHPEREIEKGISSIFIEKEQIVIVPTVELKRFMVTDPSIIKAVRIDDKISITGMNLGRAFLHVWDSEGRRSIKIAVTQKGFRELLKAQRRAIEARKMDSFKVRYSFDRYRLNSKSKNPVREYQYNWRMHRLAVSGETPWGRTSSRWEYEGEKDKGGAEAMRDLTAWDFNLRGDDLEISAGNTGAYFSDITLPATGFQGIRFRNPEEKNINYDMVWGVRGSRMWGYKLGRWTNESYFCGARGQIEPADFLHFNTTYMRSLEDAEDIGEYLYAGGAGLNFLDEAIKIESEAARSKGEETDVHNHAYKIETNLDLKDFDLLFNYIYRDIDPDFQSVTGANVPHTGDLGHYFDVGYTPFNYLSLRGKYDIFRSRGNFNPADTHVYNYDWRGTIKFNIGRDTRFSYAAWRRMREGQSSPSHSQGESYSITHTFMALPQPFGFLNLHFLYTPSKLRDLTSPSSDYRAKMYRCGMRFNVLKNIYYDLGQTWHHRHMLESGEKGTTKILTTGLLYSTQILDAPFYGSLSFRYNRERDIMENLPLSAGERTITGEGEIAYRPSSDFSTYLRINYNKVRGVLDHDKNRKETRIYGGGTYLLDTTLRWGVGGSVKGCVFEDLNANGEKDLGEKGLSGINIYAGEVRSTVTDTEGEFEFRRLKDYEIRVMYDTKMLPPGYKPTTANPQTVELEHGFVSEVNFGVIAIAEISGRIFNDVNMNGVFDDDDEGATGVLLTLDDGTRIQTTSRGYYRMEDVRPRTLMLTLDTVTLPFNLMPLTETKRTIKAKKGQYYEEDFPLYALRTVVGSVFIDKNRNKRFDAGEKGVADVQMRVKENITLTDEMGRYFLKKLKGGVQKVEVVIESIPEGYEIFGDPFKEVILAPGGEIKEDVNFPLTRR